MHVKAPTGKSKEELDALLFDRAARRNRTDPYEEKFYRGAGIKEVQAWWRKCKDWMARFKDQSEPFVCDFKEFLKALSGKEAVAQSEVHAFMENCAKRWQTREGTYQIKRQRLKPDVRDSPEFKVQTKIWLTSNHWTTWRSTTRGREHLRGSLVSLSLQISLVALPCPVLWLVCVLLFCLVVVCLSSGEI